MTITYYYGGVKKMFEGQIFKGGQLFGVVLWDWEWWGYYFYCRLYIRGLVEWRCSQSVSLIPQKLLIGSYSNVKLRLRRPKQSVQILQMKMTSHWRRPTNIKSGTSQQHLLDPTQILNLSLDDQTIFYKSLKWGWPLMEVDLKILKVEYHSDLLLDHSKI